MYRTLYARVRVGLNSPIEIHLLIDKCNEWNATHLQFETVVVFHFILFLF